MSHPSRSGSGRKGSRRVEPGTSGRRRSDEPVAASHPLHRGQIKSKREKAERLPSAVHRDAGSLHRRQTDSRRRPRTPSPRVTKDASPSYSSESSSEYESSSDSTGSDVETYGEELVEELAKEIASIRDDMVEIKDGMRLLREGMIETQKMVIAGIKSLSDQADKNHLTEMSSIVVTSGMMLMRKGETEGNELAKLAESITHPGAGNEHLERLRVLASDEQSVSKLSQVIGESLGRMGKDDTEPVKDASAGDHSKDDESH